MLGPLLHFLPASNANLDDSPPVNTPSIASRPSPQSDSHPEAGPSVKRKTLLDEAPPAKKARTAGSQRDPEPVHPNPTLVRESNASYTAEDDEYMLAYFAWELKQDFNNTRMSICKRMAEKVCIQFTVFVRGAGSRLGVMF